MSHLGKRSYIIPGTKTKVELTATFIGTKTVFDITVDGKSYVFFGSIYYTEGVHNGIKYQAKIGFMNGKKCKVFIPEERMSMVKDITLEARQIYDEENGARSKSLSNEREYDEKYNEGCEGYNPYRSPITVSRDKVSPCEQ